MKIINTNKLSSPSQSSNKGLKYRFDSPPKIETKNDKETNINIGSYTTLLPTDPLKDSVAALEALKQVNPAIPINPMNQSSLINAKKPL